MKKKFYKTKSIDETVYLTMNGFKYEEVSKINSVLKSNEWTFVSTPSLRRLVSDFWTTNIKVDLHRWMSIRYQIKYQKVSEIQPKKIFKKEIRKNVAEELKNHINKDLTYYFKTIEGKIIKCAIGEGIVYDDSVHWKRYKAGNMFLDNQGLIKRP